MVCKLRDVTDLMDETVVGEPPEPNAGALRLALHPRCADMTTPRYSNGTSKPCKAPAMRGSPYCRQHRPAHDPDYIKPDARHKRTTRELAIQARAAELRVDREEAEKAERREKHGKRTRTPIIDKLAERLELNPALMIDVVIEGLRATSTVRRRKLDPDGTQTAIPKIWEDAETGKTKIELVPVFEDVPAPDHKIRLEYLREVHDRLYGRPAQLKHVEGEINHTGQINVAAMLQAAKQLEANPEDYYSGLPPEEPALDVGAGEVVDSASPV